ncbi:MAG: GAF domain-containing protein, partial [Planctomycetes bacterium]|nr:GAF domain-containing protein [Planctomycetota bacterium]
ENAQEDKRFNQRNSIVSGNVRSVICVPLSARGTMRGVLYLSRSGGHEPFSHSELEMMSSCAIQLGMYFTAQEQAQKQLLILWQALNSMVHIMELRCGCVGRGNRSARSAQAIVLKLKVSEKIQRYVRIAALLHHIAELSSDSDDQAGSMSSCIALLGNISGFKNITPLIQHSKERIDGSGPLGLKDDDLDCEARIVTLAVAFEHKTSGDYDQDILAVIDALEEDGGFDVDIVSALRDAHIDGSLYHHGHHKVETSDSDASGSSNNAESPAAPEG